MFQSLLQVFHSFNLSSARGISLPAAVENIKAIRKASVPYISMTPKGSIMFPCFTHFCRSVTNETVEIDGFKWNLPRDMLSLKPCALPRKTKCHNRFLRQMLDETPKSLPTWPSKS